MRRLRFGRRTVGSVCFCDASAQLVRCDITAKLERARSQNLLRHDVLTMR